MKILRLAIMLPLAIGPLLAFQIPDDPVVNARAQRAAAQGISEGDLPAVPRTIAEPPPLPAPETNYEDTRKGRASRAKHGRRGRRGKSHKKSATKPASKKSSTKKPHQ